MIWDLQRSTHGFITIHQIWHSTFLETRTGLGGVVWHAATSASDSANGEAHDPRLRETYHAALQDNVNNLNVFVACIDRTCSNQHAPVVFSKISLGWSKSADAQVTFGCCCASWCSLWSAPAQPILLSRIRAKHPRRNQHNNQNLVTNKHECKYITYIVAENSGMSVRYTIFYTILCFDLVWYGVMSSCPIPEAKCNQETQQGLFL